MRPIRPEGGGRPPQAKRPIVRAAAKSSEPAEKRTRNYAKFLLLGILCTALLALAIWLTVLAVQGMLQL